VHTGRDEDSWLAFEDASLDVLTALYVRDALGIVDPGGMPALRGTGLPAHDAPDMRVGWAWTRWWIGIVENERGRLPVLPDDDADDAFARAVRPHLDSARAWAQVAHRQHGPRRDLTLGAVVREREEELGRRSRPFRLRIEVLPLATPGLWRIGESAIAVDDTVRDEPVLYADALRPILDRLV
jgi:hypothetical protein